jgi:hypothetical protein
MKNNCTALRAPTFTTVEYSSNSGDTYLTILQFYIQKNKSKYLVIFNTKRMSTHEDMC